MKYTEIHTNIYNFEWVQKSGKNGDLMMYFFV